jgi:TrpR-related protein YerC/YecD
MKNDKKYTRNAEEELVEALLMLENQDEAARFLRDLCTPQELSALSERWRVCKLLDQDTLSYREIHQLTGTSLATITRIARFLKNEPNKGYASIISKMKKYNKN